MFLRELELEEFRSYRHLDLRLDAAGLRLVGPNASGKSTVLEAVAMLATTRSPRTSSERELLNWTSGEVYGVPPFARVRGRYSGAAGEGELELRLQADSERPTALRKQIRVDGRPSRSLDAVGRLRAVLFAPEDVGVVSGPPSGRRRYLDLTISQLDSRYLRALSRFNRVLEQRNSLLKSLQRQRVHPRDPMVGEQLAFWDSELVSNGAVVIDRRCRIVANHARHAAGRFGQLSALGGLELTYVPSVPVSERMLAGNATDGTAEAARDFAAALDAARDDELRRGVTLVGPHRDDLAIRIDGVDVGAFGSRGQQRLAIVALKIAEIDVMSSISGDSPVLLLDDVLSELDPAHRSLLLSVAGSLGAQVLVTATEVWDVDATELAALPLARVGIGPSLSIG